jgi:lysophospholipase L1-like esterase
MVDAIQKQNPATLIVLQIMNVGWDAPNGTRSASARPNLTAYADNYRRLARERNLPLLDHSIAWQQLKDTNPTRFQALIPDGSHPSVQGSRAITWPTVQHWLEANSAPQS